MNTNPQDTQQPDELAFDRLVDGELSEEKRRELLAGLDNEPGGWRRCALAFLEAQCWRQAVGPPVGQIANLPSVAADSSGQVGNLSYTGQVSNLSYRRSPWPARAGTLAAMAASFLIALGLGSWARHAQFGRPDSTNIASIRHAPPANNQVVVAPGNNQRPSTLLSQVKETGPATASNRAPNPWRLVTVSDRQNPTASFSLPAVERNNLDEQWLKSLPSAMPENVLQALARTGHQIRQRRELIPVPMQDGRQLVVPVDQVEVHYVGNKTY